MEFAKIIFIDKKSKTYICSTKNIKYSKNDEKSIALKSNTDFNKQHKYYVKFYFCSDDVNECEKKHEHQFKYYPAFIYAIGASIDDVQKQMDNNRFKFPNTRYLTTTSESDEFNNNNSQTMCNKTFIKEKKKLVNLRAATFRDRGKKVLSNLKKFSNIPVFEDKSSTVNKDHLSSRSLNDLRICKDVEVSIEKLPQRLFESLSQPLQSHKENSQKENESRRSATHSPRRSRPRSSARSIERVPSHNRFPRRSRPHSDRRSIERVHSGNTSPRRSRIRSNAASIERERSRNRSSLRSRSRSGSRNVERVNSRNRSRRSIERVHSGNTSPRRSRIRSNAASIERERPRNRSSLRSRSRLGSRNVERVNSRNRSPRRSRSHLQSVEREDLHNRLPPPRGPVQNGGRFKRLPEYILDALNYYKTGNPGERDGRNRYKVGNDNMRYLGEEIYIASDRWEIIQIRSKPSLFLNDLILCLWDTYDLCNRGLDLSRGVKNIPGRSPVKLIETKKLRLLISLYADFLDRNKNLSKSEKVNSLLNVTYVLRHKIYKLKNEQIRVQGGGQEINPRRRLRYNTA